jgi:hypothetical protein
MLPPRSVREAGGGSDQLPGAIRAGICGFDQATAAVVAATSNPWALFEPVRSTFPVLEHNVSMRVCNVTIDRPAASAGLIAFRSGSVFRFRWRNSARCPAARLVTKDMSGAPSQYRSELRQDRSAAALQRDGRPRLALPTARDLCTYGPGHELRGVRRAGNGAPSGMPAVTFDTYTDCRHQTHFAP